MDKNGAFTIPREMREALGVPVGREIRLVVDVGELRGSTRLTTLKVIQHALRAADWYGPSVTCILAAERQSDAKREDSEAEAVSRAAGRRFGRRPRG